MDTLRQDVHYAWRTLWARPGVTVAAMLALGLGIGANTAVFTLIHAVLLKPLPFPDADRLVLLYRVEKEMNGGAASVARYTDWRDRSDVFESLGAFTPATVTLTGTGEPAQLAGLTATATFFRALKTPPLLGRWFSDEEDRPGGPAATVLSYPLWRDRFGADPTIVGRTITLNGLTRTIVGVAPAEFLYPRVELWIPLARAADEATRGNNFLRPLGRLKPGLSIEAAVQRLNLLADALHREKGESYTFRLQPLRDSLLGDIARPLLLLMVTVTCVLLIACANVANLLLARAVARRRELALRVALGAGHWRVVRQLLTENVLLALLGGVAGVVIAVGFVRLFLTIAPGSIPRANTVALDGTVLAFTLVISSAVGLLFGVAPAWHFVRAGTLDALREGGAKAGSASRGARFLTRTLVVTEVALTLVLVIGASLLVKSLIRLQSQDLGLRPESVTTFAVSLGSAKYQGQGASSVEAVRRFVATLLERVRHTPGVRAAGAINMLPLVATGSNGDVRIEGRPAPIPGQEPIVEFRSVTPGYFEAMGITLRAGRMFDERDTATSTPVIMINEAMAKRFWPGVSAIGRRVQAGGSDWYEVVGVVASARTRRLDLAEESEMYTPHTRYTAASMTFVVRAAPGVSIGNAVRQQVATLDPQQPISNLKTMEQVVTEATGQWRLSSVLTGLFAIVAAVLAAIGVYSVMAYSVAQRTREIGIRMALGADASRVRRLVLRDGLVLGSIGVALGTVIAANAMRLMATQLYEVSPRDPVIYLATAAGVIGCALFACWVPARRATRVNPVIALQGD
jgi:putative ABC transport system permease protein